MIKTIDTNEITEKMFQAFRDNYVDATRCIFAVLAAATAVEPAQRCNCCGYLVTDSEHKGCLRAAQQEQAQAVPVGYCLMPREPTQWMREQIACGIESNSVADVWGRLIRAVDIENKHRAKEPAQAVPVGYRLQSIAEFDAMNEWIMSGKHDQKAIDHDKKQKAFHFVRWIASLKTGGLIQARANDLLSMLEAGDEN